MDPGQPKLEDHRAAYLASKKSLRKRLVRMLPQPAQRAWSAHRARRAIERYEPRIVSHSYAGVPLKVMIADQLGAWWYDQDWPEATLPELTILSERSLRPGARVFDIGAHHGIVALTMAHVVGETGHVVAVEPSSHHAGIAVQNVLLNGCRQLTVLPAAVGQELGRLPFAEFGGGTVGSGYGAKSVASVTVDDLTATYGRPDVLYVDVEGFECQVLRGATKTLAQRPDVCVEIHAGRLIEDQGGSVADVLSYFPASDYELLVNTSPNDNETGFGPLTTEITGRSTLLALPIRSG